MSGWRDLVDNIPHSEEAERGVLGSLMLQPNRVRNLCTQYEVEKETFYIPAHRHLYEMLIEMLSKECL